MGKIRRIVTVAVYDYQIYRKLREGWGSGTKKTIMAKLWLSIDFKSVDFKKCFAIAFTKVKI